MRHHGSRNPAVLRACGFHFQGGPQFAFERGAPADFLLQRQRALYYLLFQAFIEVRAACTASACALSLARCNSAATAVEA
jgi:hypothetical protein